MFNIMKKDGKEINIMQSFAEGIISVNEFWRELRENKKIENILINDKKLPKMKYGDSNSPRYIIDNFDNSILECRTELYRLVANYFRRRKVKLKYYNEDTEKLEIILKALPEYVCNDDLSFFENRLECCDKKLSKEEKIERLNKEFKKNFHYEKKPPEWLQNPEWPIVNGIPYVFKKQEKGRYEEIYYFYDPNNPMEYKVVTQID